MKAKERRKFERFKTPFPIRYTNPKAKKEASGTIEDISYGGARIVLDESLNILRSNLLSLLILFPEDTLKVRGKIMWAKNYKDKKQLGLSFIYLPDTHKEVIYNRIFKYYRKEFTRRWWPPLFVLKQ